MISRNQTSMPDPAGVDLRLEYSVDVTALIKQKLAEPSSEEQTTIALLKN
ncbi:hypothetical protein [Cryobacterium adonitolivorans]|nr:hypothetical protein [Cryobacterium adonitolivorans]